MATDVKNDARLIHRLGTLQWLPEERIDSLAQATTIRRIHRSETIFSEGDDAVDVYLLLSGIARLSLRRSGERILVSLVGPGEIFGVSSLLPQGQRPFRCDAFTNCTIGVTTPGAFIGATLSIPPDHLAKMLEVTVGRWWGMLMRYTNFIGLSLPERLASALLELGTKFGADDARGRLLTLKVTHSDLAELVGASRQRITKELSEFERKGAIIRDGRRLIIAPKQLLAMFQNDKFAGLADGDG